VCVCMCVYVCVCVCMCVYMCVCVYTCINTIFTYTHRMQNYSVKEDGVRLTNSLMDFTHFLVYLCVPVCVCSCLYMRVVWHPQIHFNYNLWFYHPQSLQSYSRRLAPAIQKRRHVYFYHYYFYFHSF